MLNFELIFGVNSETFSRKYSSVYFFTKLSLIFDAICLSFFSKIAFELGYKPMKNRLEDFEHTLSEEEKKRVKRMITEWKKAPQKEQTTSPKGTLI